jgi:hypothetical protein
VIVVRGNNGATAHLYDSGIRDQVRIGYSFRMANPSRFKKVKITYSNGVANESPADRD